jgi:hypothetical protein
VTVEDLMGVEKGSVLGRIFSLSSAGDDLLGRASRMERPAVQEEICFFCSESGGPIEDGSEHPLAYADLPGSTLLWIRREVRKPPKVLLDQQCEKMSRPLQFSALRAADKERIRTQARDSVIQTMTPAVSIVPVAITGDLLWVGSKAASLIPRDRLVSLLCSLFGQESIGPRHRFEPRGFQSVATSACHLAVRDDPSLPFVVDEVSATVGRSGRISGSMSSIKGSLSTSMRDSDVVFQSVTISTSASGARVLVTLDQDGPCKLVIPDSPGGLPDQRLVRRLVDADQIVARVLGQLQDCAKRLADELQ